MVTSRDYLSVSQIWQHALLVPTNQSPTYWTRCLRFRIFRVPANSGAQFLPLFTLRPVTYRVPKQGGKCVLPGKEVGFLWQRPAAQTWNSFTISSILTDGMLFHCSWWAPVCFWGLSSWEKAIITGVHVSHPWLPQYRLPISFPHARVPSSPFTTLCLLRFQKCLETTNWLTSGSQLLFSSGGFPHKAIPWLRSTSFWAIPGNSRMPLPGHCVQGIPGRDPSTMGGDHKTAYAWVTFT